MKKKERYMLIGFIAGGIMVSLIWLIVGYSVVVRPQIKTSNIEAPYYESKVFQTPKDILQTKEASVSAKIPIIMYHYVEYVKDINDFIRRRLDITPHEFEGELKSLHDHNYRTYFVRDIPDILTGKIVYSTNSAILTFDDGYEDFYTDVYPILKKYQMKATIYVIYDFIGRRGFLTEKQIEEVIGSGLVELGAHTLDHLYLKNLSEKVEREQIVGSKKKFEERFGVPIKTFAYPYGAFDQKALDLVKEASYSAAVSVIPGTYQSNVNLFYLYRIRPGLFTSSTIVSVLEGFRK